MGRLGLKWTRFVRPKELISYSIFLKIRVFQSE